MPALVRCHIVKRCNGNLSCSNGSDAHTWCGQEYAGSEDSRSCREARVRHEGEAATGAKGTQEAGSKPVEGATQAGDLWMH